MKASLTAHRLFRFTNMMVGTRASCFKDALQKDVTPAIANQLKDNLKIGTKVSGLKIKWGRRLLGPYQSR